MGTSGWDDDTRGRGRSSRDAARPREGERLPGRSSERASYDYDRGGDRVRSRDDGWSDTDRSRSYSRRDERDYERGSSGAGSLGGGPPGSSGARNRRPARDDHDEYGRGGAGRMDREWSDERPARGQRPPQRGEAWESQQRRGPGNSGTRSNSSGRGGLWEDSAEMRGRRPGRPGGSDPRARSMGGSRPDMRDPRAPRRGVGAKQEIEEEKKGLGCGPAILIVVLMFVVGVGGGYGAFKVTAPKINADITTPATTTPATTPSVTPKASPNATATPKADTPHIWVASSAPYGI